MNKFKRALAAVLATATIATVFTGCGNKKNEETFKAAMENSANIESCTMVGDATISVLQEAPKEDGKENVDNTAVMPMFSIEFESTTMDKGLTTAMKMTMSMLGMGGVEQSIYLKDGVTYTSMDNGETFIKDSMATAGMDTAKLQEMGRKYNAKFMENLDYSKVEYEKTDDGLSVAFTVTKDMYVGLIKDAISEMYPDGLEEQIRTETYNNLLAMGMTEEEIASPEIQAELDSSVEMATKMLDTISNKLEFDKFDVKLLINDNQVTAINYDMEIDLKTIMEALQESVPEMAEIMPEAMRVGIKTDCKISDINAITAIEMPEFTEENTMTMEEMINASMEEAGITQDMLDQIEQDAPAAEQVPAA